MSSPFFPIYLYIYIYGLIFNDIIVLDVNLLLVITFSLFEKEMLIFLLKMKASKNCNK